MLRAACTHIGNFSMHDCCSDYPPAAPPKKSKCPAHGMECTEVSVQTMMHHIKEPWQWQEKNQGYYFCDDPDCDVVYFGEDGSLILRRDVRGMIGIKEHSPEALICYCFGVSRAEASSNPASKAYVINKTENGLCACKTSNPSGRCCLKDFSRIENN